MTNKISSQVFNSEVSSPFKPILYIANGMPHQCLHKTIGCGHWSLCFVKNPFTVRVWDARPFAPADRQLKLFLGLQHNFEKVATIDVAFVHLKNLICSVSC